MRYRLALTLALAAVGSSAQHITGRIPAGVSADGWVRLAVSRGAGTRPVDSARIGSDGAFSFSARAFPLGFYELSINDSDRVDLILDPQEPNVEMWFSGSPLQQHISVKRSDENKRLWEYKLVSKEAQAIRASVAMEKMHLGPFDTTRLAQLDSVLLRATTLQQAHLQGILSGAPQSYLAKLIAVDMGLDEAEGKNAKAVLDVFDLSDPSLMRSSLYDRAVLTFLRNLHVTSEEQFLSASDSLLAYSDQDDECHGYMLEHLITVFSIHGPDLALQHLVDRYLLHGRSPGLSDPALRARVDQLMSVSVGRMAPEVLLPAGGGPLTLRSIVAKHRYTALFFYGSTCDHCRQEVPPLKGIRTAFSPKGFEVIGIALDTDTAEFIRAKEDLDITWPSYSEFNGWGSSLAKAFQVRATPFFFVLDKEFRIVAKPTDASALGVWLEEHLD